MKILGERFEHQDPRPAYPGAEIIWTSTEPDTDAETIKRIQASAARSEPIGVPGRLGFWLITAIEVNDDGRLVIVKGVEISAEEMLRRHARA